MKVPLRPPAYSKLLRELLIEGRSHPDTMARILEQGTLARGKYRHWDKVSRLEPPSGLRHEQWWLGMKLARQKIQKEIPLRDKTGRPFVYGVPDPVQRSLHEITQQASGRLTSAEQVTNPAMRDRYIISSLFEEAITSSQLEGADTTTQVAKEMLRTGRRPQDRSEQMILNNFHAMKFVQEFTDKSLTPDLVFELHRIVTDNALDDPSRAGVFRKDADEIAVTDRVDGTILHMPPPVRELPERLEQMCAFANGASDDGFMHPVIRAVVLHFWLAHDHPFVDGNGRTARALFYWSMLRQGYWMAQFLSISKILNQAPAEYARSYLYTQTDDNDLTYFLDYHLHVIRRSIRELLRYLDRKAKEVQTVEVLIRGAGEFNHRQLAVLSHALRHPGTRYTFDSHRRSHGVVYQTARTDLLDLSRKGLLRESKSGRRYQFEAPGDLAGRLKALSTSQSAPLSS